MKEFLRKFSRLSQNVVGINHRNLGYIYPNNQRKDFVLSDDKAVCKILLQKYSVPVAPTYAIIYSLGEIQEKWGQASQNDTIAIKPSKGRGGGGILILSKKSNNLWTSPSGKEYNEGQIFTHLANIIFGVYSFGHDDKAIVEYCVKNHPLFQTIYPQGIPDIRIIAYQNKLIMAMVRIPTDMSDGKGNLHQGALGIAVSMEDGIIGKGFNGKAYHTHHPDTGVKFEGSVIPHWKEINEIALKTSAFMPLKYLGLDIVIDKELGPLVMEVNARPGLEIQNVNQKGIKERIAEIEL